MDKLNIILSLAIFILIFIGIFIYSLTLQRKGVKGQDVAMRKWQEDQERQKEQIGIYKENAEKYEERYKEEVAFRKQMLTAIEKGSKLLEDIVNILKRKPV